jgi:hypothetical protein
VAPNCPSPITLLILHSTRIPIYKVDFALFKFHFILCSFYFHYKFTLKSFISVHMVPSPIFRFIRGMSLRKQLVNFVHSWSFKFNFLMPQFFFTKECLNMCQMCPFISLSFFLKTDSNWTRYAQLIPFPYNEPTNHKSCYKSQQICLTFASLIKNFAHFHSFSHFTVIFTQKWDTNSISISTQKPMQCN